MAFRRSLATMAPNRHTATLRERVSRILSQSIASHGIPPPLAGTGHLVEGIPPTRLCCEMLSKAFRISSLTSHVSTPLSFAICVTRRIVAISSTPCRPCRVHCSCASARMSLPPRSNKSGASHLRRVELSVIGRVSPHTSGSSLRFASQGKSSLS